jgi:hypothetical protein
MIDHSPRGSDDKDCLLSSLDPDLHVALDRDCSYWI